MDKRLHVHRSHKALELSWIACVRDSCILNHIMIYAHLQSCWRFYGRKNALRTYSGSFLSESSHRRFQNPLSSVFQLMELSHSAFYPHRSQSCTHHPTPTFLAAGSSTSHGEVVPDVFQQSRSRDHGSLAKHDSECLCKNDKGLTRERILYCTAKVVINSMIFAWFRQAVATQT
jgi:hypothetical protein